MNIPKIFTSSADPEKLSLTVKGFLVGLIPVALLIAQTQHWNLGQDDLNAFVDSLSGTIILIGGAVSGVMAFIGIVRKILVKTGFMKPKI